MTSWTHAQDALRRDIEAFLAAHELSPTRFGVLATGDRHLIRQLRKGRRLYPETEERVRAFMAAERSARAVQAQSESDVSSGVHAPESLPVEQVAQ